jgi:uncharacterized protein (UPF0332 family)
MKDTSKEEIRRDWERAKRALKSAERNLSEGDIITAANRTFVACENAVYVLLKSSLGSSSVKRMKILTRLKDIDQGAKSSYDEAYDLRVQADYGRKARVLSLNKENMEKVLEEVKGVVEKARKISGKDKC